MFIYRNLSPIKAMTFDLDDTLYDNRPVIRRLDQEVRAWLYEYHPVAATQDEQWWGQLKLQLAADTPWLKNDVSLWRFTQIKQGLIILGYSEPQAVDAAEQVMEQVNHWRNLIDVPHETHRVMQALAQKIPLVAITNGNVSADKIGISHYFKAVLRAGPDGFAKPHQDLFDKAQGILNVPRSSILHVGDHPVTDVVGAKQNGLQACWFNDQSQSAFDTTRLRLLPDLEIHRLESLLLLVN